MRYSRDELDKLSVSLFVSEDLIITDGIEQICTHKDDTHANRRQTSERLQAARQALPKRPTKRDLSMFLQNQNDDPNPAATLSPS